MTDHDACGSDGPPGSLDAVLDAVRERVEPTPKERERLREAVEELTERAETAATERTPGADVLQAGSTARDTWIAGDRDIDLFVRFPPETDRETLERWGLDVGHHTLPDGREEYAEHPYVTGEHDGFDVDVVPCFRLDDATEIRSAVDRTPFHTRYLERRLTPELADDVRVAKAFAKGVGVYGSDLRTRGFSGYLVELLVCEYGGFEGLVAAAAAWHPPVELDPADHGPRRESAGSGTRFPFDDPLIVIDPTDPGRNVAAVCSAENVARLQHYARELLSDPRPSLFEPDHVDPITADELRSHLDRRGTTPVAIRFQVPGIVEDQLYPQLRKSLGGVTAALDDRGFDVLRASTWAEETAVLFAELAVSERPTISRHDGPPVSVREHADGFYDAYADGDAYGPFLDGDRYAVEREREFTTAREFVESERLFEVSLGAHVESALETGYDVLVGDDVLDLLPEFDRELARYLIPSP